MARTLNALPGLLFAVTVPLLSPALAHAAEGECASGFCGTPNNNGGGGGGGGGGSVLVNNTDIGDTYSTSDDYDGDGFEDDFDNCPFVANRDQGDGDGDGRGNACDNAVAVANPDQRNTDGDALGDVIDEDDDNDSVGDAKDSCPLVPNTSQADTDGDGKGDACDDDDDNDGVLDRADNCPLKANPDQSNSAPNSFGDACDDDADQDELPSSKDNCEAAHNPDQADRDKDGVGDACDLDMDGDGMDNNVDLCPLVADAGKADGDHDGLGDACDINGFCFVVGKNQDAPCLDPRSAFQVTATPLVRAQAGSAVYLGLYANRDNVGIRYTWTVTKRPEGSRAAVSSPRGAVAASQAFEYRFSDASRRPAFRPDLPGHYELTLAADLVDDDAQFPGARHAESVLALDVVGEAHADGGCSVTWRKRGMAIPVLAGLLALLLVAYRSRR
ncbi:MAG: thrombospondin type 3 repeat-containing protein [Deltaproteobacteria bacterium]|nr:thrombospondin type 3 repeat-containing protein [Deltaproteobacteria bacterium]